MKHYRETSLFTIMFHVKHVRKHESLDSNTNLSGPLLCSNAMYAAQIVIEILIVKWNSGSTIYKPVCKARPN